MPQIPGYIRQKGLPSSTGMLGLPGAKIQNHIGQAIGDISNAFGDIGEQFLKEENSRRLGSLKVRTIRDLNTLEQQLASDPDYASHGDQFKIAVDSLRKTYEKENPKIWKNFVNDFDLQVASASVGVQKNQLKRQVNHSKAVLDSELDGLTRSYGMASTALERQIITDTANGLIETRVTAGVINEVDGGKRLRNFASNITETSVRQDLFLDPEATENALLKGKYKELSPEKRIVWLERATAKVAAQTALRSKTADRAERDFDKNLKLEQEAVAKDGYELLAKGELNLDWVVENEARLPKADYKALLDKLTGDDAAEDDADTVADLYGRVATEDVGADAIAAYKAGDLRRETMGAILSRNDKLRGNGPKDSYKRAQDYIKTSLGVNEMANIPGQRRRLADAVMDFDAWTERNPDATDKDTLETARRLVREYSIADWNKMTISLPFPDWMTGSRVAPDVDASKQSLVSRFMEKHSNNRDAVVADPEYQRATRVLRQWEGAIRMRDLSTGATQQ
jgi:hypothetical protein